MRHAFETHLVPPLEAALVSEASARGLTPEANQERILSEHAKSLLVSALPEDVDANIKTPQDGRAWILSRNPDLQRALPGRVDWRQEVHEGHRY